MHMEIKLCSKIRPEKTPTSQFSCCLCSDIQKPAFFYKVGASQEPGSRRYLQLYLCSSPSLFPISLSVSLSLTISLFQGTPVFEQTSNHITSIAALLFSRLLNPPTVPRYPLPPPPHHLFFFFLP